MSIADRLTTLKNELGNCKLLAVSKTHPAALIEEAYKSGQIDFGENRVQELTQKHDQLPDDIRWHLIGTLQTNKVKYVVPFVYMIHSVDSLKLLEVVEKEATKINKQVRCLMQVYIASENTKHGLDIGEVKDFFLQKQNVYFPHIIFSGLMGMATNTEVDTQVDQEFASLFQLFTFIKSNCDLPDFNELSMGMSSDYLIAIKNGSTMVRLGSSIFGSRA